MNQKKTSVLFYSLGVSLFLASCGSLEETSNEPEPTPLEQIIETNKKEIFEKLDQNYFQKSPDLFADSTTVPSLVQQLYRSRKAHWSDSNVLNNSAKNFITIVTNSASYGLDSGFYNLQELKQLEDTLRRYPNNKQVLAKAEWEFSKSSLLFFTHLKYGFLNHDKSDSLFYQLKIDSLKSEDLEIIRNSIANNELPSAIESLEPSFYEYKNLINGWKSFLMNKTISSKKVEVETLKKDSVDTYIQTKKSLIVNGYLDTSIVKTDSGWIAVLKHFQLEHGLQDDGRVGSASAYALSRSNEDRWLSVMASLEKLKWKKRKTKSILYANIPAYSLKVIEENEIKQEYRTVVGKTINRTPEFDAKMSYLIVNPYWHIPNSISSKEILPKLKKDSALAGKKGYRILDKNRKVVDPKTINWNKVTESSFNYKISQVRSGGTALGKVKFIFANKYSIYFHDTPSKRLFKNDIRAYSHGCVRVQNPLDLASYLLSKQDTVMTIDSVNRLAKKGTQKRFDIENDIKVYITYHSAEGTKDGRIQFFRDIYKKEKGIKSAIKSIVLGNPRKTRQ
ncbi:MAG: L,D-transpeptidase family protein [Flavobacteriales bacterium]